MPLGVLVVFLGLALALGLVTLLLLPVAFSGYVGQDKVCGRWLGYLLGLTLSWFGFFIVVAMPDDFVVCPRCGEHIPPYVLRCRYCGRFVGVDDDDEVGIMLHRHQRHRSNHEEWGR
jgi:hypothetical protein